MTLYKCIHETGKRETVLRCDFYGNDGYNCDEIVTRKRKRKPVATRKVAKKRGWKSVLIGGKYRDMCRPCRLEGKEVW